MAKKTTSSSGSARSTRRSRSTPKAAGSSRKKADPVESVDVTVTDDPAPESRRVQADRMIDNKVLWALGAGVIPIPLVDLASIAGVQVKLVRQLSELYGTTFDEERTKKIISVLTASVGTGVLLTGVTASVLKILPGVGSVAGGVALPIVASASTYALGKVFVNHFEEGGSIFDFEQDKAKEFFKKAYAEGEKVAAKLKTQVKAVF